MFCSGTIIYLNIGPIIYCCYRYDVVEIFQDEDTIRDEKDWIESDDFQNIINNISTTDKNIEKPHEPSSFITFKKETVQNWYFNRATEIENLSGMVDAALEFAELAISNGCRVMNEIVENLRTLYTLIYKCQSSSETYYSLDYISRLNDLEKLTLIMSHSYDASSEFYMKSLQDWLLPYIIRRQTIKQRENLIKEYFIKVSKEDLIPCYKLFQLKIKNLTGDLFLEINIVPILLACLYQNENTDQIELCHLILNEIVNETTTSESDNIQNQRKKILITLTHQESIKLTQIHLKACDLFKRYGVYKTLSYIKDSCSNADSCRDSLVKLTWFASKRANHLKINEWIDLMKDLQYLQLNLFKEIISYQECTEIFLSSLLGSRNLDNIKLASQWLQDIFICDKNGAVKLTVRAAQEYFNASSNYFDPDMEFAKACLELVRTLILDSKLTNKKEKNQSQLLNEFARSDPVIKQCIQLIETEMDLIDSMKLIAEFGLNILPVQVRLNTNRIEIMKDVLKQNKNAFKDHDNLLRLASLLRISEPEVMLLIAEHSLIMQNLQVVSNMCSHLMRLNYSFAWRCVYQLALTLGKLFFIFRSESYFDKNHIIILNLENNIKGNSWNFK